MSDEEHQFESKADAGASKTYPQQAGTIRKGGYIVIKGRACKVVEVSTSKTGKHGHAKCHFVAIDIFNGKKLEDIVPSSHNCDVPHVTRTDYQLIDIAEDGFVSLLTDNGNTKDDLKLPTDETLLAQLIISSSCLYIQIFKWLLKVVEPQTERLTSNPTNKKKNSCIAQSEVVPRDFFRSNQSQKTVNFRIISSCKNFDSYVETRFYSTLNLKSIHTMKIKRENIAGGLGISFNKGVDSAAAHVRNTKVLADWIYVIAIFLLVVLILCVTYRRYAFLSHEGIQTLGPYISAYRIAVFTTRWRPEGACRPEGSRCSCSCSNFKLSQSVLILAIPSLQGQPCTLSARF